VCGVEVFYKHFYVGGATYVIGLTWPPVGEGR
jgi:hypothetical protein